MDRHETGHLVLDGLQEELFICLWQVCGNLLDVELSRLRRHDAHTGFHADASLHEARDSSLALLRDLFHFNSWVVRPGHAPFSWSNRY